MAKVHKAVFILLTALLVILQVTIFSTPLELFLSANFSAFLSEPKNRHSGTIRFRREERELIVKNTTTLQTIKTGIFYSEDDILAEEDLLVNAYEFYINNIHLSHV